MSQLTWGELKDRISRRSHKNLQRAVQSEDVEYWAKVGIEMVEQEEAWPWLRTAETITLVADQYEYSWPASLARYDAESFRYGASNSYLIDVGRPERLDFALAPNWRDSATTSSTPEYFCSFGRNFWIGAKPSSTFVASSPTVYFYGWKSDTYALTQSPTDATVLSIPREVADCYVVAALSAGLQQEDDPDWARMRQTHDQNMIKLRGMDESIDANKETRLPRFARHMEY